MIKYKTLVLAPITVTGLVVVTMIFKLAGDEPGYFIGQFIDFVTGALQLFCIFTLTIVLRRHHESLFRVLPFYLLILLMAVTVVFSYTNNSELVADGTYSNLKRGLNIALGLSAIVFIITIFTVKNPVIKTYFRLYGISWLCTAVILTMLKKALADNNLWYTYSYYINNILVMLPLSVIFYTHYSLYIKHEVFKPGNVVIIKRHIENLIEGMQGTVIKKHRSSNYYDVEFLDSNGSLLNVLQISGDDIQHTKEADLEDRVNSFKQAPQ